MNKQHLHILNEKKETCIVLNIERKKISPLTDIIFNVSSEFYSHLMYLNLFFIRNYIYFSMLMHSREIIVLRSNFLNGDFDGFKHFEVPLNPKMTF